MRNILTYIFVVTMLTACGGEDSDMQDKETTATDSGREMQQPATNKADGKQVDGMTVVDHSQDEEEFRLRRSLGGVERMIEQYKQEGYNTDELEERKANLEKELDALMSR